jgi:hypothetical protein
MTPPSDARTLQSVAGSVTPPYNLAQSAFFLGALLLRAPRA